MLIGGDSASPQTKYYPGKEIWGIYVAGATPHVWTKTEILELGQHGVRGMLPIVVPPQEPDADGKWWFDSTLVAGALTLLVAQARAWGLTSGSPICLDIEEATAEKLTVDERKMVAAHFVEAAKAYSYIPWTYGGATWHEGTEGQGYRWLAKWDPEGTAQPGAIPAGFDAYQYQGGVDGGAIDLDLFEGGLTYLGADLQIGVIGNPSEPAPAPAPSPEPAPAAPDSSTKEPAVDPLHAEEIKVDSAIGAEQGELRKTVAAPETPIHESEIHTLTSKIRVHLAELDILATKILGAKESSK